MNNILHYNIPIVHAEYHQIHYYPNIISYNIDIIRDQIVDEDADEVQRPPVIYRRHTNFAVPLPEGPRQYVRDAAAAANVQIRPFIPTEDEKLCPICIDIKEIDDTCKLNCGHVFCCTCISTLMARYSIIAQNSRLCPLCRTAITSIDIQKDTEQLHPTLI